MIKNNLSSNKSFGALFSFIFFLLTIYAYFNFETYLFITNLLIVLFFLFFTICNPEKLNFLNNNWIKFSKLLGMIVNPIILSLIFISIFIPISIIFKISKRDELFIKKKISKTFWSDKKEESYDIKYFDRQF